MNYSIQQTKLDGLLIFEYSSASLSDEFFTESFNQSSFNDAINSNHFKFVQDNQSKSVKNVLRGMHYQINFPQGKLIRVLNGSIFDVSIDLRKNSKTFRQWFGIELTADSRNQIWIPPGFAHGFLTISDSAEILYKTTDYWYPEYERTLLWSDPEINIEWPILSPPILAPKDANGVLFKNAEVYE